MRTPFSSGVAIAALLAWDVRCSPLQPDLVERNACNEDNLLRALQNPTRTADSYPFCSSYIGQPAETTVTVYTLVYPLYLYNLQRYDWDESPSAITYATKSASPVPGDPQTFGFEFEKRAAAPTTTPPPKLELRQGGAVPSYLATYPPSRIASGCSCLSVPYQTTVTESTYFYTEATVSTCTTFVPDGQRTYPAYCAPSLHKNAPTPSARPNVVVGPKFPVPSKMDCCLACTEIFNCVWWKFDWGSASAKDQWAPGSCHYAWHTDALAVDSNTAKVCPNGAVGSILAPYGRINSDNIYGSGYNEGACGNALQLFESDQIQGIPDDYYEMDICPV